ncbi:MAG: GIY-YIG nuclease family protein [Bradyrhizobium sp.]|uniref:GIY-YIG nuclease family protein n=1 Tax=Bradyrhizobium sp. TaxID=376 RepID=UPI003D0DA722
MIYFVESELTTHIKIGLTNGDNVSKRVRSFRTGNPSTIRILGTVPGEATDEAAFHRYFQFCHVRGEWFWAHPALVWFIVSRSDFHDIASIGGSQLLVFFLRYPELMDEAGFSAAHNEVQQLKTILSTHERCWGRSGSLCRVGSRDVSSLFPAGREWFGDMGDHPCSFRGKD